MIFKAPHLSVRQGKRVKVLLRDGSEFIDKFIESKSKYVIFQNRQVNNNKIRSMIIYKGI